jgi:hypothetical protein
MELSCNQVFHVSRKDGTEVTSCFVEVSRQSETTQFMEKAIIFIDVSDEGVIKSVKSSVLYPWVTELTSKLNSLLAGNKAELIYDMLMAHLVRSDVTSLMEL